MFRRELEAIVNFGQESRRKEGKKKGARSIFKKSGAYLINAEHIPFQ